MLTGRRRSFLRKGISSSDVECLLRSCDRRTALGRRDCAVILTLLLLGLRAGEVAVLSLDDIDWLMLAHARCAAGDDVRANGAALLLGSHTIRTGAARLIARAATNSKVTITSSVDSGLGPADSGTGVLPRPAAAVRSCGQGQVRTRPGPKPARRRRLAAPRGSAA